MVNQTGTTHHIPHLHIDTEAMATRLALLADASSCPHCEPSVTEAVADLADLLVEIARLYAALLVTRRQSANRLAAIRATLSAERDGEPNPLDYLRDELAVSPGMPLPESVWGWWR